MELPTSNYERWLESCFLHGEHRILETSLLPFSLNHYVFLDHIGSPLIHTEKPCSIEDCEIFVLVCSQPSPKAIAAALLPRPSLWQTIRRAGWRKRNRKQDLQTTIKSILAYQEDFVCLPDAHQKAGETHEKLPWLLTHAALLIKETGWSREKVMELGIGELFWWNLAFGYLNTGETNIVTDKEKLAMKALESLLTGGKG